MMSSSRRIQPRVSTMRQNWPYESEPGSKQVDPYSFWIALSASGTASSRKSSFCFSDRFGRRTALRNGSSVAALPPMARVRWVSAVTMSGVLRERRRLISLMARFWGWVGVL